MEKVKKRSSNFTSFEVEKLVSLVGNKIKIIENKKSDARTWQDKKEAWKEIELDFNNSIGGVFRNEKHLKQKYEALKRDTRKKVSAVKLELKKTSYLTPTEKKVKDMILLSAEVNDELNTTMGLLPSTITICLIQRILNKIYFLTGPSAETSNENISHSLCKWKAPNLKKKNHPTLCEF